MMLTLVATVASIDSDWTFRVLMRDTLYKDAYVVSHPRAAAAWVIAGDMIMVVTKDGLVDTKARKDLIPWSMEPDGTVLSLTSKDNLLDERKPAFDMWRTSGVSKVGQYLFTSKSIIDIATDEVHTFPSRKIQLAIPSWLSPFGRFLVYTESDGFKEVGICPMSGELKDISWWRLDVPSETWATGMACVFNGVVMSARDRGGKTSRLVHYLHPGRQGKVLYSTDGVDNLEFNNARLGSFADGRRFIWVHLDTVYLGSAAGGS